MAYIVKIRKTKDGRLYTLGMVHRELALLEKGDPKAGPEKYIQWHNRRDAENWIFNNAEDLTPFSNIYTVHYTPKQFYKRQNPAAVERGKYGQWIVADIIDGYRVHRQYYDCTKAQALRQFKEETKGTAKNNPLRSKAKYWVGITDTLRREVFAYSGTPTAELFRKRYFGVIGPFSSKLAAEIMQRHGAGNPHLQSVAQANKFARMGREKLRSERFNV